MPTTKSKLTGKKCQCPVCGEVFSVLSNFDRHRKFVDKNTSYKKYCVYPEHVGLVIGETALGTFWKMPGIPDEEDKIDSEEFQ